MFAQCVLYFWGLSLLLASSGYSQYLSTPSRLGVAAERTRAIALLFSCLQCFPSREVIQDKPIQRLISVHQSFHPEDHLEEYKNRDDIVDLVNFVDQWGYNGTPADVPFTNTAENVGQMVTIFKVLYHNADNWSLFYDTATWLLQRVSTVQLWWCVMVTCLEKFGDTVTVPSHVETFPQFYIPKNYVLRAAGLSEGREDTKGSPLQYWMGDPKLHEFHGQWHMDNPFWWNDTEYGVTRHRKGELFFYMHHQISVRYRVEWWSNGLEGDVRPLGLQDDYRIPEGYTADVLNLNYADFYSREAGKRLGDYGTANMAELRTYYNRLEKGIEQGFLVGSGGRVIFIRGSDNGTDVLGATTESSLHSVNVEYYGSFHNVLHGNLSVTNVPQLNAVAGVQHQPETSMRDPIFYRLHARADQLFVKFKRTLPPYSKRDLSFKGVSLEHVRIQTLHYGPHFGWGLQNRDNLASMLSPPVLKTYFTTESYDISTAARPCKAVTDPPITALVNTINYVPFWYHILIRSRRSQVAYGMVRVFIWPEFTPNGTLVEGNVIPTVAIELDRFRVRLDAGKDTVVWRSSLDSSITKRDRAPGIKQLYRVDDHSEVVTNPNIQRACGFPNNILIPRGTKEGMPFKMVIHVSDETETGYVDPDEDPHFPLCGALNGRPFPDSRPMGFPFDRPGTTFNLREGVLMKNVREFRVLIKHQG